jgi:hypothetical protein
LHSARGRRRRLDGHRRLGFPRTNGSHGHARSSANVFGRDGEIEARYSLRRNLDGTHLRAGPAYIRRGHGKVETGRLVPNAPAVGKGNTESMFHPGQGDRGLGKRRSRWGLGLRQDRRRRRSLSDGSLGSDGLLFQVDFELRDFFDNRA